MATTELKSTVQNYIENADTRLLKMIKALVESYREEGDEFILNDDHYSEIDKRREAHSKGNSQSYSWEQVKKRARNSLT